MYDGDACDAYAHAQASKMMMTHLTIDDAYFEWRTDDEKPYYQIPH